MSIPQIGMVGIAWSLLNRVQDPNWLGRHHLLLCLVEGKFFRPSLVLALRRQRQASF